jgi:putative membrane protein
VPHWHAHPDVWLLIAALAGGYAYAVRRIGPRKVHAVERPVTRRQVAVFAAGLVAMWVAADWPIHDLAETRLYSVHMLQHVLLSLVAPPLLMVGTPDWLWRTVLGRRGVQVARFVTRPLIALVLFNVVLVVTHIPDLVTLSVRSEPFHFALHSLVFTSALIMWSPVLNPLIDLPKLSYPARMFYLFLQSLVPTVPASFLTFGHTVLYHVYERMPRMGISALTDQLVAGLIMKLVGGFLLWSVIGWYFFKWYTVEEREKVDVLEWSKLGMRDTPTRTGTRQETTL